MSSNGLAEKEGMNLLAASNVSVMHFEDLADYVVDKEFKVNDFIFSDNDETKW